jgi:hypothetical protein
VELRVFEGRTHGNINQERWEEVVNFALEWVAEKLGSKNYSVHQ